MTTKFQVSDTIVDNETIARKTHVRVGTSGDVSFDTPFKIGVGGVTNTAIYEAHKYIKPSEIIRLLNDEQYDRHYSRLIAGKCKGGFNILSMEYDSKDVVPTERMVEAMSDIQYNHTQAIPTPSWFNIINNNNNTDVSRYISLSEVFLSAASVRNNKPILGTIPQNIPPGSIERVVKFFIDRDVTSFIVDSHGRTLFSSSWIRAFQRALGEYNLEKECILYSLNAYQGTVKKNEDAMEARDFIGFMAGLDIIGGKHIKKYASKGIDRDMTVGRMFDSATYTHMKVLCTKDEKKNINDRSLQIQIREMGNVRTIIEDGNITPHIKSKKLMPETINEIISMKNANKRLDDFI